jgi:antagonist of KipI
MSALIIERPGILMTVQDLGRWGHQALGIPVSGAMDTWSARLANRLVGNPDGFAVLEVTLVGPRFIAERDISMAVVGAAFDVTVDGDLKRVPFTCRMASGARVAFGSRTSGARAYIAIDGGIATPQVLGSASTHLRARFGGFDGRALSTGDRLPLGAPSRGAETPPPQLAAQISSPSGTVASALADALTGTVTLHVLPGPPGDPTTREAFDTLCAESFIVSPESDRMGYRLTNKGRWPTVDASQLSGPTVNGAVQLPPGGTPILLMADRQTTGGYAQIAVLQRADRPLAGQLAPGDRVSFMPTTFEDAAAAHAALETRLTASAPEVRS